MNIHQRTHVLILYAISLLAHLEWKLEWSTCFCTSMTRSLQTDWQSTSSKQQRRISKNEIPTLLMTGRGRIPARPLFKSSAGLVHFERQFSSHNPNQQSSSAPSFRQPPSADDETSCEHPFRESPPEHILSRSKEDMFPA